MNKQNLRFPLRKARFSPPSFRFAPSRPRFPDPSGRLRRGGSAGRRMVRRRGKHLGGRHRKHLHADGNAHHHQPCHGNHRHHRTAHRRKKPEEAGNAIGTTILLFAVVGVALTILLEALCRTAGRASFRFRLSPLTKPCSICASAPGAFWSSSPIT